MANYKDNPNKNWLSPTGQYVRVHVFNPEESVNKDDWYKDVTTFEWCSCFQNPTLVQIGHIIEDNSGARFRVLSVHWKWEKDENNKISPVIEFTVELYMRHGKQNPYMI